MVDAAQRDRIRDAWWNVAQAADINLIGVFGNKATFMPGGNSSRWVLASMLAGLASKGATSASLAWGLKAFKADRKSTRLNSSHRT